MRRGAEEGGGRKRVEDRDTRRQVERMMWEKRDEWDGDVNHARGKRKKGKAKGKRKWNNVAIRQGNWE